MHVSTADRINSAAARMGMVVIGVVPNYDEDDVRTIAGVSLAQMQTATEVIEAENVRQLSEPNPGRRLIRCVCEDTLLLEIKRTADDLVQNL
jgi:hypothetical protein